MSDLATYPDWLDLVTEVEPATGDGSQPAWHVTLKARVGPFARSKRLRIVRSAERFDGATNAGTVRFERAENDGRDHAPWIMDVAVSAAANGSEVRVDLSYGGGLWTNVLDPVLGSAIDRALTQLPAYVAG